MEVCGVEFTLISCGCSRVTDEKDENISQHSSFLAEFWTSALASSKQGYYPFQPWESFRNLLDV